MKAALALTITDRWAIVGGTVTAVVAAAFFLAGGQMIAIDSEHVVLLATSGKVAIFAALAVLAGLATALQIAAVRLRLAGGGGAAGAAGLILALIGASCCTPLLWPTILSFVGISGVTLLGVNLALHRWFWLAVTLAGLSLVIGIWLTGRSIAMACQRR